MATGESSLTDKKQRCSSKWIV